MRRSRKKRTEVNVSLFPFLAVLICTLGVLIVMLVIAAKQADSSAEATRNDAKAEQQAKIDEAQQLIDGAEIRIRGISRMRPKVLARLKDSRENHSHLRNDVRKIAKQIEAAKNEFIAAAELLQSDVNNLANHDTEPLDETLLDQLRSKIDEAEAKLSEKRLEVKDTGPNRFVIVPYTGNGGTFRRPIFVECSRDELVLQPLGIVLKKSEFELPLESGNMLDAALLTIRDYWKRYDLAGDQGNPYPLIVVRPDGAETFVLARRAMKSWDDEFGYELVDSDRDIEFGKPDDQLVKEVRQAVEVARQTQLALAAERRKLQQHRAQFAASKSRQSLTVSRNGGGFVAADDTYSRHGSWDSNFSGADALRQLKQEAGVSSAGGSGDQGLAGSTERRTASNAAWDSSLGSQQAPQVQLASGQNAMSSGGSFEPRRGQNSLASTDGAESASGQDARQSSNRSGDATQAGASAGNAPSGSQSGESGGGSPFVDLSIAKKRGSGWALPTRTPGAVGYLRPIRIACFENRIEILSPTRPTVTLSLNDGMEVAVERMVEQIWRQVDDWGIAGTGSYWKPQLRVSVDPAAKTQFEQLQGLLHDSGLVFGDNPSEKVDANPRGGVDE